VTTRGFIFDLDGTLADTMPAHFVAWTETAKRYGLNFPEDEFYALGGTPTVTIAAMLATRAGVTTDPVRIAKDKEQAFVDGLTTPGVIRPIAPVIEIARGHMAEGLLAIASGGTRGLVDRTLGLIGIADWFRVVLTSEDTARHKPEPDVFLEAARRLGAAPIDCIVYEDTDIGLEAARRAKMQSVDVRPLYQRWRLTK
jgi:beta-phosphoglucomutase-like phosphatase (HAD superfamily)